MNSETAAPYPATSVEQHPTNPIVRVARPRGLSRWIPALAALHTYLWPWLAKDLMAGLVLTAILVPVGMGYAEAAGSSGDNLIQETISLVEGVAQGLPNWTAFAIGASCPAVVLIFNVAMGFSSRSETETLFQLENFTDRRQLGLYGLSILLTSCPPSSGSRSVSWV